MIQKLIVYYKLLNSDYAILKFMLINYIENLSNFIENSKVVLCDLWGVIHNGKEVFSDSRVFLEHMYERKIKIIFISNAPRPNSVVESGLIEKLNLSKDLFHSIVSSGDITINMINKFNHGYKYFHLGPPKDYDLLEEIQIEKVETLENADFILCTGFDNDEQQTPKDYKNILSEMLHLNLPMVCANPDLIVIRGEKKIFCAGSIAEFYAELGGKVRYYGKPYHEIYTHVLENSLSEGLIENKSQMIAIGDSVRTDIKGASNFGINSIFVETGIHKDEIINSVDIKNFFYSYLDHVPHQINIVKSLKL